MSVVVSGKSAIKIPDGDYWGVWYGKSVTITANGQERVVETEYGLRMIGSCHCLVSVRGDCITVTA